MKIMFFVSSLNAGGAERVATTLANAWAQRGDEVILVPTYLAKHTIFYRLDERVRLTWLADCPAHGLLRRLPGLGKWWQIRKLIRDSDADVVLSFLTNVNVNVLIATTGMSVPVIVSERTNPVYSQSAGTLLRFLRRVYYRRARMVVMQTQASVQPFKAMVPNVADLAVVPNPLPPSLPPPVHIAARPSDRPHIVALGRLVDTKQFDVLIDAFAQLAEHFPDWSLVIWGEGPQRASLAQQIKRLGLEGRVTLAGRTSEPWQALSSADVFAMTSRVEGFPNALLEAMALGLPCVTLDCPSGPAELSRQGQDAVLLPLNDSKALVRALHDLMTDEESRQTLGRRAAQAVRQRYGLNHVLAQWDTLFERIRKR